MYNTINNDELPVCDISIYRVVYDYGAYKSNWFLNVEEAINAAKPDYTLHMNGVRLEINILMVSHPISSEIMSLTI